ncbi:hypothetical protein [Rhodococcus qingshengii]|uniref:hypothetical protein n=1 Tax=Rhodococcus qingshengii TaxID=334542 RepID=UPI001BE9BC53|nr:hypothetical protein [Rhodococcus qingshengii]MBT2271004.1 hypothetical protein [Rhodococcus qingshengii]
MSTYLSPFFFKARTNFESLVSNHALTASDFGLYYVLMCVSKRDLLDGKVSLRTVAHESRNLHFRAWKPALEKLLEAGLITEVTDTYIQLDWTGQTTREAIEKRSVTRADGTHDVAKMHDSDDHTFCRKPHCDIATDWAKGYDGSGKKGVTRKVTEKVTEDDPTGDRPPVPQSQSQRQRQKDSGYDEDEKTRQASPPAPAPGGAPHPSTPADELGDTNRAPTDSAPTDDDFGIYDMTQGGKRIA